MTQRDKLLWPLMRHRVQEPPDETGARRQSVGGQRFELDFERELALPIRSRNEHVVMLAIVSAGRSSIDAQQRARTRPVTHERGSGLRRKDGAQGRDRFVGDFGVSAPS